MKGLLGWALFGDVSLPFIEVYHSVFHTWGSLYWFRPVSVSHSPTVESPLWIDLSKYSCSFYVVGLPQKF